MDAHPGLAPGISVLQTDGSTTLPCARLKVGRSTGAAPVRRSSQDRMLAVTSRPPFESDPPLVVTLMTQTKMVAASGIAPDSPRFQRGANLSQLHSRGPSARTVRTVAFSMDAELKMRGRRSHNSRWSVAYRPRALLLSYKGEKSSPGEIVKMAPPLGIAPSSHRLTGGPHTLCVERNAWRRSAL
jgi:hypothetical protein